MASFKKGDWVQVRATPDYRWEEWDENVHTLFCDRIGFIEDIIPDIFHPDDRHEDMVKVSVLFEENVFDDRSGYFYAFFKKRHLVLSSEYEAERQIQKREAVKQINHFEEYTRNLRDDIFRHIFSPKEDKMESAKLDNYFEKIDEWEEDTLPSAKRVI